MQTCVLVNEWVEKQAKQQKTLENLAAIRHESMAPYEHSSGEIYEWSSRSDDRTRFCERVVSQAEKIAKALLQSSEWRHAFYDDGDSRVRLALETKSGLGFRYQAEKLKDNLGQFQRDNEHGDDPLLVVVFDEASGLLKRDDSDNFDPGLYHALHRIISCLREFPIWFFFLSTESQLRMLLPPNHIERTGNYAVDPSARLSAESDIPLERLPPFLAFPLDVEDRRRMEHEMQDELAICLNEFAAPEHMAKFGRPLWHEYNPADMNKLAKLKLVGGNLTTDAGKPQVYNPKDVNHVFAALSFRLSLDPCLQNPRALPLVRTAVNSYMRVVISMDHETGFMTTITPSEPVVAKAAMEFLCENAKNWLVSIRTLAMELLQKGLVEKGLKGELYARLVLTLARDCVWKVQSCQTPTFTVNQFLTGLYADNHHSLFQNIPVKLLHARMNFNHFILTGELLAPEVLPEVLHDLLRRSAGMQLLFYQDSYDIMIPIYFGDSAGRFDASECGVIMIQVKNKDKATTPQAILNPQQGQQTADSDKKKNSSPLALLEEVKGPVLFLLFDLGAEPGSRTSLVQVSNINEGITVWAIHSRGHDTEIFGCLKHMNCEPGGRIFFTSIKSKPSVSDTLCQRNMIFSALSRSSRYSHEVPSPDSGPASGPAKRKRNDSTESKGLGVDLEA